MVVKTACVPSPAALHAQPPRPAATPCHCFPCCSSVGGSLFLDCNIRSNQHASARPCARGRRGATAAAAQVAELSNARGWTFTLTNCCGSNSPLKQPRHPHAAHAAAPCCSACDTVEAGKHDFLRDEHSLRFIAMGKFWARDKEQIQSTALAMSGGQKQRSR